MVQTAKSYTIIKAGSILGPKPSGVDNAPDALLAAGLDKLIDNSEHIKETRLYNDLYSTDRDGTTGIINTNALRDFSIDLSVTLNDALNGGRYPIILGGDCSILVGITAELARRGRYGLISFDGHADFYTPVQSTTGEAADMDIALVTGRGDDIICNIHNAKPYINDEDIIHIGQRDQQEAERYGSTSFDQTPIHQLSLKAIQDTTIGAAAQNVAELLRRGKPDSYWLHIDTDVLHDDDNPAVDYRLPGGLRFNELELLLASAINTGKIIGVSIAIYNPYLDENGQVGEKIAAIMRTVLNR